jgi:molybdopterin-guanine dinucleotide biosynthesis protein A
MGADKATVVVDGIAMIDRVRDAMADLVERVVVLGGEYPGFECWPDVVEPAGPLSGLATALGRAETDRVLVVAVDHAFVRATTLEGLLSVDSDLPVIPVDGEGVRQVTCAVYPTSIAQLASEEVTGGGSLQSLLDRTSFEPVPPEVWQTWGEDGRSWFSVDTLDALAEASRIYL